jgi:hypothetical protein
MPAFCLAVGKSLDPYQAGSTKGAGESISPHEFQGLLPNGLGSSFGAQQTVFD